MTGYDHQSNSKSLKSKKLRSSSTGDRRLARAGVMVLAVGLFLASGAWYFAHRGGNVAFSNHEPPLPYVPPPPPEPGSARA